MKLIRLSIRNLATYERQDIDFTKLTYPVFVTGNTGAGKTSLFVDAVTAALYGKVYGEGAKGLPKEFIMKGKSEGSVELEFEIEGIKYLIKRTFRTNGTSDARLYEWAKNRWKLVAHRVSDVDKKIEDIIGLTFDGLKNSAIVRQGDVHTFLTMRASDRREILLDILRIRLDKLRDLADKKTTGVLIDLENYREFKKTWFLKQKQ